MTEIVAKRQVGRRTSDSRGSKIAGPISVIYGLAIKCQNIHHQENASTSSSKEQVPAFSLLIRTTAALTSSHIPVGPQTTTAILDQPELASSWSKVSKHSLCPIMISFSRSSLNAGLTSKYSCRDHGKRVVLPRSERAERRKVHIHRATWCRPANPRNVNADNRGANISHLGASDTCLQNTCHASYSVKTPNCNRGI